MTCQKASSRSLPIDFIEKEFDVSNHALHVTNPALKQMLFAQIVSCIDNGGMDDLLRAGYSAEFLDTIRHRKARDFIAISNRDDVRFVVSFDEDSVFSSLMKLDMLRRDAMLYEYFVRHGATVQFVCTLFRKSASEVRALRALFMNDGDLVGQRGLPPDDVRDRIHVQWAQIQDKQHGQSLRERIYSLHKAFPEHRIDALCRTLNEFDDTAQWLQDALLARD